MPSQKSEFIKVPTETEGFQTMPVEPSQRLSESELRIEKCTPDDAEKIAEGLYLCFPEDWWAKKEPPELRPAGDVDSSLAIRTHRMAQRLTPAITDPHHCFMKAVYTPTGETVGIAGWTLPSNPNVHSLFRRSAVAHYSWAEKMGWSDADVDVMWSHVSNENWSERFAKDDAVRAEAVGGGRHWYLAPLLTWPGWQGRGVGKRLMDWAMKRADAEGEVMYLESRPSARAVYLHLGFEACGEYNMIRRGPKGVGKSGAERNLENEKGEEFRVEVVAKESETDGAR